MGFEPMNNGFAIRSETAETPIKAIDSEAPPPVAPPVGGKTGPEIEPDLANLIQAWPNLPKPIRAAIRAMVTASFRGGEL